MLETFFGERGIHRGPSFRVDVDVRTAVNNFLGAKPVWQAPYRHGTPENRGNDEGVNHDISLDELFSIVQLAEAGKVWDCVSKKERGRWLDGERILAGSEKARTHTKKKFNLDIDLGVDGSVVEDKLAGAL